MHRDLINALTRQMETNIEEMLPELQQNPTAINKSLICAMRNLKDIFVKLKSIEKTIELIQNNDSDVIAEREQLKQLQAVLVCLDFSRLIAVRLNCYDEDILRETYKQLYKQLNSYDQD